MLTACTRSGTRTELLTTFSYVKTKKREGDKSLTLFSTHNIALKDMAQLATERGNSERVKKKNLTPLQWTQSQR
jgi:hypothetical protein